MFASAAFSFSPASRFRIAAVDKPEEPAGEESGFTPFGGVELLEGSEHVLSESTLSDEPIHFSEIPRTGVLPATSCERMNAKSFQVVASKDFIKTSDCWQRSKRDKTSEFVRCFVEIFFGTVSCLSKKYRELRGALFKNRETDHNFFITWREVRGEFKKAHWIVFRKVGQFVFVGRSAASLHGNSVAQIDAAPVLNRSPFQFALTRSARCIAHRQFFGTRNALSSK